MACFMLVHLYAVFYLLVASGKNAQKIFTFPDKKILKEKVFKSRKIFENCIFISIRVH